MSDALAKKHAAAIRVAWGDARSAIIAAGMALIEAKDALAHGHYEAMIRDELPFSSATARKLVAIAKDSRLSNRSRVNILPPNWTTLYQLTLLDDEHFDAAIKNNLISADMKQAAARRLVVSQAADHRPPPADQFDGCTLDDLRAAAKSGVKYGAIHIDPPWKFETWSDAGADRSPDQHYPTMTIAEIAAMPIADLAASNCVLFIWVVNPLLERAFHVINAWGFEYKTKAFNWIKTQPPGDDETADPTAPPGRGWAKKQGKWTRANGEDCLLATRGSPGRNVWATNVDELVVADVRDHSQKPDRILSDIEALVAGPYLDAFGRTDLFGARPGWAHWGNQSDAATFRQSTGGK